MKRISEIGSTSSRKRWVAAAREPLALAFTHIFLIPKGSQTVAVGALRDLRLPSWTASRSNVRQWMLIA